MFGSRLPRQRAVLPLTLLREPSFPRIVDLARLRTTTWVITQGTLEGQS
jgi:hypothetical protein